MGGAAGFILGRLHLERYVEPWVLEAAAVAPGGAQGELRPTWNERIDLGIDEVRTIIGKVWPYLLAAVALGAVIHGCVPTDFFTQSARIPARVTLQEILGDRLGDLE